MKQPLHYLKKIIQIGPIQTSSIIINRLTTSLFDYYSRRKALQKKASITWNSLNKQLIITSDFSLFFAKLQKKELFYCNQLLGDELELILKANNFAKKHFDILGSGEIFFKKIPWCEDFRLKKQQSNSDYSFSKSSYYKDIHIFSGQTENLIKDIKVPWELSRFNHIIYLGAAYQKTQDTKYVKAFVGQIADWLDENPYLLGPNWVCAMDVGLRAINWIIGFSYFKNAEIDDVFWQRFVCSLYDHMQFLENNWEIYDFITSNHYLSDLIGYFYLCWFFSENKDIKQKSEWCYQEILKEFEKQVFDEGTDYESTTNYHKLVTELFYHFYLLAPELGFSLPGSFTKKIHKMFSFIDWCTPINGKLIQIGDNDSGKVVSGISSNLIDQMKEGDSIGVKHFLEFGISIKKTEKLYLSLRHHAYQAHQPTAHFHNDAGSITLAINGIDIFVDPGSYVYTPSAAWRNYFRSVSVHNTFYIKGKEPIAFDGKRLFNLDLPEHLPTIKKQEQLYSTHDLYAKFGLRAHRAIDYVQEKEIIIEDRWEKTGDNHQKETLTTAWNFTLNPTISLKQTDNGWILLHRNQEIAHFSSTLIFECMDGFYSPSYGIKTPCRRLVAHSMVNFEKTTIFLKF